MQKTTSGIKKWLSVRMVFEVAINVIGFLRFTCNGLASTYRASLCTVNAEQVWRTAREKVAAAVSQLSGASDSINFAMTWWRIELRLSSGLVLSAWLAAVLTAFAQEPSASLKQADADYRAGVAALERNDLKTAQADFENVVRLAPSAEQGYSALGAVLVRLGRTSDGIRELEKALTMKPGDSSAQTNLALAYQQSGHSAKALPLFAKLEVAARAEKRPLTLSILIAYARALASAGQLQAATTRMKEAVASDPHNAVLQDELGSLYAQRRDWPNAEEAFSAALAAMPDFAIAHMHLGLTRKAEEKPGAMEELSRAYQLTPENATVALEYGRALAAAGQDEQAIPVLEQAAKEEASSTAAAYQLGLVLQRSNRLEEAITLLEKAATAEPQNAEALTNLGMALSQAQRAKEAVPILQRAVKLTPENVTAHQDLAAAFIQLSQFEDAVEQLRAALKLAPDAPQLHYNLGLALKMEDDAVGAIPELETAQKLDPAAPEPPYILGVLYMQAGRYADAARELKASLKLRPENGDGWATLGSVDNKLDQLPDAVLALREAIRQLPRQPDPHLTLAAVLVKQNQPAEAAEERRKAADLMRVNMNRQRAEVATNAANSQMKDGKIEDAIAQFREALSYDADYAAAHAGLAEALERQGKTDGAAAERQKAAKQQTAPDD
jgi:protein O-GlcNAc transferase